MSEERTQLYLTERSNLIEAQRQSYQQFDKAILTLAGGGLALSLAFLRDLVPVGQTRYDAILIISWVLFAASLLVTLVSFLTSQMAFRKQIDYLDEVFGGDSAAPVENRAAADTTNALNWISASLFILAVITLIVFVSINMKQGGT